MPETKFEEDAYAMDRYSRQIGAYGVEAMAKLVKMKVLVSGLGGVGVEAAKNLALAGPGGITVHDNKTVEIRDLGANFFLRESDVGNTTRAKASMPHIQDLNRLVRVALHEGELTEELVKDHTAIVVSGLSPDEALRWNKFCRANKIGYFQADVFGAMGYCFVDLGDQFKVRDLNGEQPVRRIVQSISNEEEAIISLVPPPDGRRHNLDESDHDGWITLEEVEGPMGELLNGKGPFKVQHVHKERMEKGKPKKIFDAFRIRINVDTSKVAPYTGGGTMTQVKRPIHYPFRSLERNLDQPVAPGEYGLMFTDGAKFGRAEQLHVSLCGLWEFQRQSGRLPKTNDSDDAKAVLELAKKLNDEKKAKAERDMEVEDDNGYLTMDEFDEEVCGYVSKFAATELQPLACFFGGVVAQEVVKMSGKFTPLKQWIHLDVFEVLPEVCSATGAQEVTAADRTPQGTRYDDLVVLIGRPTQERLTRMSTFLVGCGALGCELLKNFAMVGLATSGDGVLTVTDNDNIEVSNLSRQFLFREHNVGQAKSVAGAAAALEMNPSMKIKALEAFVAPKTEDRFDDAFWESLDFVTNALDNVTARLYVDSRCVFYRKPLLESGTLGTKCNVQVVLPDLTQSYGDGPKDAEGDAIPMCTLRNFPSQIEHCIEWARAQFFDLFSTAAQEGNNFVQDPVDWIKELRSKTLDIDHEGKKASAVSTQLPSVRAVVEVLRKSMGKETCFADCVNLAYVMFFRLFRDKIVVLTEQYPADAKDAKGDLFWSGTKRFPRSVSFDPNNAMHMLFVVSMANLLAVNFGLQPADIPVPGDHPWRSNQHVKMILENLMVPEVLYERVDMSGQEGEAKEESAMESMDEQAERDTQELKALLEELETMSSQVDGVVVEPADFEKDADWNFHIDFITATSNLRAWNYRLKEASRHQVKMIAGKIIPAIATTTAAVTGLVMVEMLKLAQKKPLAAFKDSSNSLGINGYFFSEPVEASKFVDTYDFISMEEVKGKPSGFTKWDKTVVKAGDVTLGEFLKVLEKQTGLNITSLYHNNANIPTATGNSQWIYERDCIQSKKETYAQRMDQNLVELIKSIYGEDVIGEKRKYIPLEVDTDDADGQEWRIPSLVFYFKF